MAFLPIRIAPVLGILLAGCGGTAAPAAPVTSSVPVSQAPKPATSAASPRATPHTLKVAYVSQPASIPILAARTIQALEQRGLTVDDRFVEGNIVAKALVAKEIDAVIEAPTAMITADINGGADMVSIASLQNHSQFEINVEPSIKTAADLKGKSLATAQPGTSTDFHTRLMLGKLGLKATDVVLRPLGSSAVVYPALLSGQIQAATLGPPASVEAESKGYLGLVNDYDLPYQSNEVEVLRSRLDELTPALIPFLESLRDGMRAFQTQPSLGLQLTAQANKQNDQALVKKIYDFVTTQTPYELDLQPSLPGIQTQIDFLGSTVVPAAKGAKAQQFVDTRLLAQLGPVPSSS